MYEQFSFFGSYMEPFRLDLCLRQLELIFDLQCGMGVFHSHKEYS